MTGRSESSVGEPCWSTQLLAMMAVPKARYELNKVCTIWVLGQSSWMGGESALPPPESALLGEGPPSSPPWVALGGDCFFFMNNLGGLGL